MAAVSRRKQPRPQRLSAKQLDEASTHTGSDTDPDLDRLDSHVCGRCCAQFFRVQEFIEHKEHCRHAWPSWHNGNQTEQEEAVDLTHKTQHTQNDTSEQPDDAKKLKVALNSLDDQQLLQLQLIEQIYNSVLPIDGSSTQTSFLLSPPSSNETCVDTKFTCDHCETVLRSRGAHLWHLSTEHVSERPFGCKKCSKRFSQRREARHHQHENHRLCVQLQKRRPRSVQPDACSQEIEHDRRSAPPPCYQWQDFTLLGVGGHNSSHESSPSMRLQDPITPGSDSSVSPNSYKPKEAPLDLSYSSSTFSLSGDHRFDSSQLGFSMAKPLALPSFVTPLQPTTQSPPTSTPMIGSDDDWESMMEVSQTDEMEKIRQLVGDKPRPMPTDPNQCLICRRILSCKSALQMHYRTHTGERPFKCKICMRAFTTKGNLKTHMGVHRSKHPFRASAGLYHQCPICQKRFFSLQLLQQHISLHTTQLRNGASCPSLAPEPEIESTVEPVPSPVVKQHPVIPEFTIADSPMPALPPEPIVSQFQNPFIPNIGLQLPECNPFSSVILPNTDTANLAYLAGRPNTTCNICYKVFACNSALEIHYRSHTKERPFKCTVCKRGFSTKGNMKQHLLTHKIRDMSNSDSTPQVSRPDSVVSGTSERNHSSDSKDNDASTPDRPLLSQQDENSTSALPGPSPLESIQKMWAQTEPPPPRKAPQLSKHQCGVCFKHFSSSSALQIHMRTHTGDKPFKCNICSRAFTTKGNLKVHMGTHVWHNPSRRGRRIFDFPSLSPTSNGESHNGASETQTTPSSQPSPFMSQPADMPWQQSSPISGIAANSSGLFQSYIPGLPRSSASTAAPAFGSPNGPVPSFGSFSSPLMVPTPSSFGMPPLIVNNSPAPASGSVEAMMWMWRTVCSVCQKVCANPNELEEHLKEHLHLSGGRGPADHPLHF